MKYDESVYSSFGAFMAQALENAQKMVSFLAKTQHFCQLGRNLIFTRKKRELEN